MSEYNRFVSYIYVYENNQKTLNNGFVRVETRDERCFVYIHMKDLYGNPQTSFDVYMVKREKAKIRGIHLGQMKRDGSQGEFYIETQKDNIENSGISLGEMAGIVVVGGQGQKYGTCWDDELLDMRSFYTGVPQFISMPASEMERVGDKTGEEETTQKEENTEKAPESMPDISDRKTSETDVPETSKTNVPETSETKGSETEKHRISETNASETSETNTFEMSETDARKMPENGAEPQMHTESIALTADETAMREAALTAVPLVGKGALKKMTLEEKLEKIMNQGMKMYPFEDNEVLQCIRLELQDIGLLPMKFWSYVSNSFLLHNYYSYRHLILGRLNEGSYFLGVPGMGQPKDRFMAQMFGFSKFKGIRNSDRGQSDFGYWYVILK